MNPRRVTLLLASTLAFLVASGSYAKEPQKAWMNYLKGEWSYEVNVNGEKQDEGTVTWRLAAKGKAGTGRFKGKDGKVAFELAGKRADSKSLLVIHGYGSEGNYWHLEYTKITPELNVEGPMHGVLPDGRSHKGTLTGKWIDKDHYEFRYAGKTAKGEEVKMLNKISRKKK